MPVLVERAESAVVMDTLPVLKLTEWYGLPGRGTVYTYGRLYVRGGEKAALCVGMTVFDGRPPATQRACAAFDFGRGTLWLRFSPGREVRAFCVSGQNLWSLPEPECVFGAGSDEQGWYWQAQCTVDEALLAGCGAGLPAVGSSFSGGLFLTDEMEEAFGSAFAFSGSGVPKPGPACFDEFVVVPY